MYYTITSHQVKDNSNMYIKISWSSWNVFLRIPKTFSTIELPLLFFFIVQSLKNVMLLFFTLYHDPINQSVALIPKQIKRDAILITLFWIEQFVILYLCIETKSLKNPWIIDILKFSHKQINELLPIINMLQHLVLW
jgi:hypothetical protein